MRATIAQERGTRHANYFARPDRDPQNKWIHWVSEVAGTGGAGSPSARGADALPPNPAQAVEWCRQVAEAGIAEAQYRLGILLKSGKTDTPNGLELGVSWLRKAADQGHP